MLDQLRLWFVDAPGLKFSRLKPIGSLYDPDGGGEVNLDGLAAEQPSDGARR